MRSRPLRCAAAMPIHAAMPAMLQCQHSNTARFRERRAEGQMGGLWTQREDRSTAVGSAPSCSPVKRAIHIDQAR